MPSKESLDRAARWYGYDNDAECVGKTMRVKVDQLAAEFDAARLEEARWWRHLVLMHDESYFAVEGDKRIWRKCWSATVWTLIVLIVAYPPLTGRNAMNEKDSVVWGVLWAILASTLLWRFFYWLFIWWESPAEGRKL